MMNTSSNSIKSWIKAISKQAKTFIQPKFNDFLNFVLFKYQWMNFFIFHYKCFFQLANLCIRLFSLQSSLIPLVISNFLIESTNSISIHGNICKYKPS